MADQSCPIKRPDLSQLELISLQPGKRLNDFQEAVTLARKEADQRFGEYMLLSWYDRDRDLESPAHASECAEDCRKEGYIHYGLSHGARLRVDIEEGRFVFFFTPVVW
jgi:hypothetical protein